MTEFSAQQQEAIARADALAARFAPRVESDDREGRFAIGNWRELHESGYLRAPLPRAYGGEGADLLSLTVAQEHLARGDAATALVTGMLISVIGRAAGVWPEPVHAEICRDLATHGGGINNCVTEADLGSISRGGTPGTLAEPAEGGWRITGRKIFVTGAPALRWFVTAIVLPPTAEAPQGTLASAIVRHDSPGLSWQDTWSDSLGLRTCGNFDVHYAGVFVPEGRILERRAIGRGGRPAANPYALPIAAVYLGIAQAACDAACDYANGRVPSALGKPIAETAHIQQWIGQMQVQIEAARAVLHQAARAGAAATAPAIAAAKYLCTNTACTVTDTALRVAGGFSLTRALPLERHFRDARAGLFQPPQDDLALGLIGRAALTRRRAVSP